MFKYIKSYFFMLFAVLSLVACGGTDDGTTPPPPPPPPVSPVITTISPNTGITVGGDVITITGTNFVAKAVMFGSTSARLIHVDNTTITVAAPQVTGPETRMVTVVNTNNQTSNGVAFAYVTAEARARTIMGANYLGIEDAEHYFGVTLTAEQRGAATWIPFTKETLEAVKNTHVLVLVPPLSLAAFEAKIPTGGLSVCPPPEWFYNNRTYLTQEVQWQLIKKTVVEGSLNKTLSSQLSLLSANETPPLVGDLVYLMAATQLAKNEKLFTNVLVRASDNWFGNAYYAGGQNTAYGISMTGLCAEPPTAAYPDLGVASQRKHEELPRP